MEKSTEKKTISQTSNKDVFHIILAPKLRKYHKILYLDTEIEKVAT